MAETFVNFLSGSPLNRVSWLRPSHSFLNAVTLSPSTRWILFNAGQPLITSDRSGGRKSLTQLTTHDIRPLLGSEPFFGQGKDDNGEIVSSTDGPAVEAARHRGTPVVFLGVQETSSEVAFENAQTAAANLNGTPFFALDVAEVEGVDVDEVLNGTEFAKKGAMLNFTEPRAVMGCLDEITAGIFAEARSLVDWNQRNKFCPACGAPTYSQWGGWKLSCSTLLPWADNTGRKPCPTAKGLHNFTHPRTDPAVIMIAIDKSGDKILLGRNKKFPGRFYSALAGFVEPGESFEDAVKREMWEEAGVKVWNIRYHSCQPWPYPASLMIGFYATADSSAPIRTDLDNELDDAQWFTREQVLAVLQHPTGSVLRPKDYKQLAAAQDSRINSQLQEGASILAHSDSTVPTRNVNIEDKHEATEDGDPPPFRVPRVTAIAGVLIRDWAEKKISSLTVSVPGESFTKGNL